MPAEPAAGGSIYRTKAENATGGKFPIVAAAPSPLVCTAYLCASPLPYHLTPRSHRSPPPCRAPFDVRSPPSASRPASSCQPRRARRPSAPWRWRTCSPRCASATRSYRRTGGACSSCARPPTRDRQAKRRHLDGAGRRLGAPATVHRRPEERRLAALPLQRPQSCSSRRVMARRSCTSPMAKAGTCEPSRSSAPACSRRSSSPPTDGWSRSCPTRIHAAATKRATPACATRSRRIPSRCTR